MSGGDNVGHELGRELGQAAVQLGRPLYHWARLARRVDVLALGTQAVLACFGLWWPWVLTYSTASLVVNTLICWKLNPRRARQREEPPG
jgi:hypothetical protein